jgi:Retrotransposon gag protein
MPPKKSAASVGRGPVSPVDPGDLAPPDDRSEPSPGVDEPTPGEYNDLLATHRETLRRVQELEDALQAAQDSSHTSPGPREQLRDPRVESPPEFSGKISEFPNFMAACSLVFTLCPNTYSRHERKVLFVISRLRGMAMSWARNIVENPEHPYRRDYPAFKAALSSLYSDRNLRARNEDKLSHLVQTKSAAAYAAEFQSLIDPLELDDSAKCLLFHKGLKPDVKDAIATVGRAATFALLVDQAIGIDQRKHQRTLEEKKSSSSGPKNTSSRSSVQATSQPNSSKAGISNMAEDRNTRFTRSRNPPFPSFPSDSQPCGQKRPAPKGPISHQEKSRRTAEGLCWFCGESGHLHFDCPRKPKSESVAAIGRYQAPSVAFERAPEPAPSPSENYKSQATTR